MSRHPLQNQIKININFNIDSSNANSFHLPMQNNPNKDELCVGRKIENSKMNLLNLSNLSDVSTIKKFPIPLELMKSKVKNTKEKKSRESSLINKTTSEITEINKSLNKSIGIKVRESQNSSENAKNDNTNTNESKTNINKSLNYINRGKMNASFHHQKKPQQKNQNNLSFHHQKHSSKSKNTTKKEELQYLLTQLQKFTPEINMLLKKDKGKDEKKSSPLKTNALMFKKKKKSHHSPKKTKKPQLEIKKADEVPPNLSNEILKEKINSSKNKTLHKIINENNKRLALEKLLQKQKEDKLQQMKQEKVSSLLKMNEKIRKTNKKRFTSAPKNKNQDYFSQNIKKISDLKRTKPKKSSEKERREELGLSWLNNMQQSQYLRVIERNRSKSKETKNDKSIDFMKKKENRTPKNSEELKKFIIMKKKEYKNNVKQNINLQCYEKQKKFNNLRVLKDTIKQINLRTMLKGSDSPKAQEEEEKSANNLPTAAFVNPMSRIPTENEHLEEKIEIDELDKSSFSERYYLNTDFLERPIEKKEEKRLEKMNEAANIIQKIWRGYKTRQLIEEYLNFLLQEEEEEKFLEYNQEEINISAGNIDLDSLNNANFHSKADDPLEEQGLVANHTQKLNSKGKLSQKALEKKTFVEENPSSFSNEENDEENKASNTSGEELLVNYQESNDNHVEYFYEDNRNNKDNFVVLHENEMNNLDSNCTPPSSFPMKIQKEISNMKDIQKDFLDSNLIMPGNENFQKKLLKKNKSNEEIASQNNKNPHEMSNEKNISNASNVLHYREINENSKSLITIKDFEGDYSDLLEKEDYSRISNKKNLNFSNDFMMKAKYIPNFKKSRDKSSTEFLREQLMDNLKNLEEMVQSQDPINKNMNNFNNSNSISSNNIHEKNNNSFRNVNEDQEVKKLKNQQLGLWKEMFQNLQKLQEDSTMDIEAKSRIIQLQKFTEMNLSALNCEENDTSKNSNNNSNDINRNISHLLTKKPLLQINIEEDNNAANPLSSNKNKTTPSEQNRSSFFESSLQQQFPLKGFNITPNFTSPKIFDANEMKNNNNMRNRANNNDNFMEEKANNLKNNDNIDINSESQLANKTKELEDNTNNSAKILNVIEKTCASEVKEKKSLFSLDPFQEFAMKFKSEQKKPLNLLSMREKVLEIRQEAEIKRIEQLLASNKVSPKSFEAKKNDLEKWVYNEKNDIIATKNDLKKTWDRTNDTLQKTRRDLAFMKKIGGQNLLDVDMKFSFSQDDLLMKSTLFYKSDSRDFLFSKKERNHNKSQKEIQKLKVDEKNDFIKSQSRLKSVECEKHSMENEPNYFQNLDICGKEYKNIDDSCKKPEHFMNSSIEKNDELDELSNQNKNFEDKSLFEENEQNIKEETNDNLLPNDKNCNLRVVEENKENENKYMENLQKVTEKVKENFQSSKENSEEIFFEEYEENELIINNNLEDQHFFESDNTNANNQEKINENPIPNSIACNPIANNENQENSARMLVSSNTNESKPKENLPISREDLFEEFKETDESKRLRSEEESQRTFFSKESRKGNNEEIKLDCFMDFQELEEELNLQKDSSSPIEEIRQENQNQCISSNKSSENYLQTINNNLTINKNLENNANISENILEDLISEFFEESFAKKHAETWNHCFSKKSHLHNNKEFDLHYPRASEDFSLIKSQELVKTENSKTTFSSSNLIKEYLQVLKEYLLAQRNSQLGKLIIQQINTPLGLDSIEKLRFLHKNLYKFSAMLAENIMIPYVDREIPRVPVIPEEYFKRINDEILNNNKFSSHFPDCSKEEYFHLIFNSFNEALDFYRPFSLKGQPNFLKNPATSKKNMPKQEINSENIHTVYEKAVARTIEWSETLCGLLPDKEEKTNESMDDAADIDFITHLREEKMGRMLAQEVIDSEAQWINYEEEEVEIKLEVSQLVWEEFLWQNINEISNLLGKR